nr:MAG TPA: hypothetical protein [Caudoviricetes sp.]
MIPCMVDNQHSINPFLPGSYHHKGNLETCY